MAAFTNLNKDTARKACWIFIISVNSSVWFYCKLCCMLRVFHYIGGGVLSSFKATFSANLNPLFISVVVYPLCV